MAHKNSNTSLTNTHFSNTSNIQFGQANQTIEQSNCESNHINSPVPPRTAKNQTKVSIFTTQTVSNANSGATPPNQNTNRVTNTPNKSKVLGIKRKLPLSANPIRTPLTKRQKISEPSNAMPSNTNHKMLPYTGPGVAMISSKMTKYTDKISKWDFDVYEFINDMGEGALYQLTLHMFNGNGLLDKVCANKQKFGAFVIAVQKLYFDNAYHNFIHAVDVLVVCRYLVNDDFWKGRITIYEALAVLLSALTHDVGHAGYNNAFYATSEDPLTRQLTLSYGESAVLEHFHVAATHRIMKTPANDFLGLASKPVQSFVKNTMSRMILATDISKNTTHTEHLKALAGKWEEELGCRMQALNEKRDCFNERIIFKHSTELGSIDTDGNQLFFDANVCVNDSTEGKYDEKYEESVEERMFLLDMMLKMSDISNPCKPFPLSKIWGKNYVKEAHKQGREMKNKGFVISDLMDEHKTTLKSSQLSFIKYVVKPVWEAYSAIFSVGDVPFETLLANDKEWKNSK